MQVYVINNQGGASEKVRDDAGGVAGEEDSGIVATTVNTERFF